MSLSIQRALSFYLTGTAKLSSGNDLNKLDFTDQELDDFEMNRKEFEEFEKDCKTFKNPLLNSNADLNTLRGQFRLSGLGVINSLFSGVGAGFGGKLNFLSGLSLAGLSVGLSSIKKLPFLSEKYSIFSFGGNLIRGPLHILDSVFSTIGEQGSKYNLPSIVAGLVSIFSMGRTLSGKDNKSLELPNNTVSGTLGRTAIHHVDSMLASKATQIFSANKNFGTFLATSLTSLGLLFPDKLKKKEIPWKTMEGFIAQGGTHFIDSLFSGLGNAVSSLFGDTKKMVLGGTGLALSIPLVSNLLSGLNYQIPFGTFEGRLVRGIFHAPETLVFNLGSVAGSSVLGIPLSLGFAGLTYFACLSKKGKNLIKNLDISRSSLSGLVQRLPFDFIYSMISATGVKLSKLIPAPVLMLLGPAISYRLGEKFKNVNCKFDDMKGLMLRNTVHLWETVLSRSAYQTGRMITGTSGEELSSGSVLSDGRWLSDDGRIVPTMAIGKQLKTCEENNLLGIGMSALSGVGLALAASPLLKYFSKASSIEERAGELEKGRVKKFLNSQSFSPSPIPTLSGSVLNGALQESIEKQLASLAG